MEHVEKLCRAGQATDDSMAHAHFMLDPSGHKSTLGIYNNSYYATATMVARTHLNVTLHCIACLVKHSPQIYMHVFMRATTSVCGPTKRDELLKPCIKSVLTISVVTPKAPHISWPFLEEIRILIFRQLYIRFEIKEWCKQEYLWIRLTREITVATNGLSGEPARNYQLHDTKVWTFMIIFNHF
jgi:hypothetical protein